MIPRLTIALILIALGILAFLLAPPAGAAPRLPTCTAQQAKTKVVKVETIVPGVVRRTHAAGCYTMTRNTGATPSQSAPKKVK